jgi:hypothetical protein
VSQDLFYPHSGSRSRRSPWRKRRIPVPSRPRARALMAALPVLVLWFLWSGGTVYRPLRGWPSEGPHPAGTNLDASKLAAEGRRLETALSRKVVSGNYIVIDVTNNRLQLRRADEIILNALCSSGSGIRLKNSDEGKTWEFHTPHGEYRVLSKIEDPIWKKPDWAFEEDREPVPSDPSDRLERGMLGEYGLNFGDGYLIHGTLYERLLGRSVTHGCVRLGRNDLRKVYEASKIGTPIFIF